MTFTAEVWHNDEIVTVEGVEDADTEFGDKNTVTLELETGDTRVITGRGTVLKGIGAED